jgi:hypothetical protein
MTEFLVELYRSRHDVQAAADVGERARLAADAVRQDGPPVRLVRSIFVPDDETCFLLFEAVSVDAVRTAMARAGLTYDEVHATADQTHPTHGGS